MDEPWYKRLRDNLHTVTLYVLVIAAIITYVVHYLVPEWGSVVSEAIPVIIVSFLAVITLKLESFDDRFVTQSQIRDAVRNETSVIRREIAPLGNVRFYPTERETFKRLADMTGRAQTEIKATRFSPGDITQANDYWRQIKTKACDRRVRSIRIHSLAYPHKRAVRHLFRLIEELKGAQSFVLGIVFFENEFEIILSDQSQCIICFHEPDQIIGSGLHFDSSLPKGKEIISDFDRTFDGIRNRCHVLIDFGEWVRGEEVNVRRLQAFINRAHERYLTGQQLEYHDEDDEEFLRSEVFGEHLPL